MLLKRLEISGFKSFAKAVTLEFPTKIVSIVGPNGSGKSNIADAIRWVLGEQSMKHLRGKKGEDLIFSGTPQVARQGKASVSLAFDNRSKIFPVEFDEVIVSRKVYRDGANDYSLNGSTVRLKDIIELLSKVGLGASQHHIIAQGDADRILYASPKERKSMIEEALGLRIFELKKNEAERKLAGTEENIKQVESLRRELGPHLKYLEAQSEKAKNAAELRVSLESATQEYVASESGSIGDESLELERTKKPLEKKIEELEKAISRIEKLSKEETSSKVFFEELKKLDGALDRVHSSRRALERELGKAEAELKVSKENLPKEDAFSLSQAKEILLDLLQDVESAGKSTTMESVRNAIFGITQKIYRILESLSGDKKNQGQKAADSNSVSNLKENIQKLESDEKRLTEEKKKLETGYEERSRAIEKERSLFKERTEELASARDAFREISFREEKLAGRKKEFELDFGEWLKRENVASFPVGQARPALSSEERAGLRKKIERLRIRLEEAGGVDDAVLNEYEETKKRDEFLGGELEDLKAASKKLQSAFEDLDERIRQDFESGISKINTLFKEFFQEIFGGGKAEIFVLKPEKRKKPADEDEEWDSSLAEYEEPEDGLDIVVDIPRKRIKSLSMLSGGERALTSIALLFAVSTVNPPPFLVLDETDAALDEANSAKYASMLRDLSKKTQLIVVTHNRETMKAADVLYGVTMGADGVSKLLSIKFEEAENVLARK